MCDHEQRIEMLEKDMNAALDRIDALEQRLAEAEVRRVAQLADDLRHLRQRGLRICS